MLPVTRRITAMLRIMVPPAGANRPAIPAVAAAIPVEPVGVPRGIVPLAIAR